MPQLRSWKLKRDSQFHNIAVQKNGTIVKFKTSGAGWYSFILCAMEQLLNDIKTQ